MNHLFDLLRTPQIFFGPGKIKLLPQLILSYGHRVLIVTGKSSFVGQAAAQQLFEKLNQQGVYFHLVQIAGEPSPEDVDSAVNQYIDFNPEVVVAIGGGSAIDAGKAISAMLCEQGSIVDVLEGVGTRKPTGRKIPFIAVPTTSGTGSEATSNAVITRQGVGGFKKSLRHANLVPDIALVDPDLTLGCPASVTAASGLDAMTQLLEAYLSTAGNPLTDTLALEGLQAVMLNVERAVDEGQNSEVRAAMSYGALISGIVLANAGLGLVHGFAQPLGSHFPIPHGIVCGNLIGAVNSMTVKKLKEQNDQTILFKYARVAAFCCSDSDQEVAVGKLLTHFDRLIARFNLPRFSEFGVTEVDLQRIIDDTGHKNHPVLFSRDELAQILKQRL